MTYDGPYADRLETPCVCPGPGSCPLFARTVDPSEVHACRQPGTLRTQRRFRWLVEAGLARPRVASGPRGRRLCGSCPA